MDFNRSNMFQWIDFFMVMQIPPGGWGTHVIGCFDSVSSCEQFIWSVREKG